MTAQVIDAITRQLTTVGMRVVPFEGVPKITDFGYTVGTLGRNKATEDFYILRNNTANAAQWEKLSSSTTDFYDDVLSIADATLSPPSEIVGARYILDRSTPVHADWDGAIGDDVVQYDGATWISTTPSSGGFCYVLDETTLYIFSSSWNNITAAIPDATTTTKGVASFDQYDFNVSSGAVSQRPGSGVCFVGKWGNDAADGLTYSSAKLTIQAAVTACTTGGTILVHPGTYTETVTNDCSNMSLIAVGKPNSVIITQADANVVDFGIYTGLQYKGFTIQCTAATSAINTVQGTSGLCAFKECHLKMTSSANIVAVAQPAVGAITDPGAGTAGTLKVILGKVSYAHTGACGGTANKGAFKVEDGGVIELGLVKDATINNSGTALVTGTGIDTSSTGVFKFYENDITVNDADALVVAGLAHLGGTGTDHEHRRNNIHVNIGATNAGYGIFTGDTASTTCSFFNHIHVTDIGGSSYGFNVGTGSTLISQLDDIVAADGNTISGTFIQVNSPSDGNWSISGALTLGTNLAPEYGGAMAWSTITGATSGVVGNGYFCNHAATRVVVTLPAVSAVGDIVAIAGVGAAGWEVAQNAGNIIHSNGYATTTGIAGKLESTQTDDCISLICSVANTEWKELNITGNITII